jgi:hypothetical protein
MVVRSGWWRLARADGRVYDREADAHRGGRYGGHGMVRARTRGTTGQEHGLSA